MNDPCELLHEDIAAYALGNLDPNDVARVEAHLATCPRCTADLHEYQQVVALLPLGLPLGTPSKADREALRAALHAEPVAKVAQEKPVPWYRRLLPKQVFGFAMLFAACVALIGGIWFALSPVPHPNEKITILAGSTAVPEASGRIILAADGKTANLYVTGLPVLPSDRAYQLWFVKADETRTSGAVFTVNSAGTATVPLDVPSDIASVIRVGVTEEPSGGSPGPTGRGVLRGSW